VKQGVEWKGNHFLAYLMELLRILLCLFISIVLALMRGSVVSFMHVEGSHQLPPPIFEGFALEDYFEPIIPSTSSNTFVIW
jgi:hypothetical protein